MAARLVGQLLPAEVQLVGKLSGKGSLTGTITIPAEISADAYEGPYEFTPGPDTQVIEIENLLAKQNITIDPIPSNYGLITWNGLGIRVS